MVPGRSAAKTRHMTTHAAEPALDRAHEHARTWLASLADRPVSPRADADTIALALGRELPEGPTPAEDVVDLLANACEPGLTAMPSGPRVHSARVPSGDCAK